MKCYNHPDHEAIGICKACGKALCRDCVHESENVITCGQGCSEAVASQKELLAMQAAQVRNARRINFLAALFSIGMGIIFMLFSQAGFGLVYDFIMLLGGCFTGYGLVALLINMIIIFKSRKKAKS